MTFSKTEKQSERVENIWMMDWVAQDYSTYAKELYAIGIEYLKCKELADTEEEKKKPQMKTFYAADFYQFRNGGITRDFCYKYDATKARNGEWQNFEINRAKLDKYFKWMNFNKSEDERILDEETHKKRFKEMREKFGSLTNKT